MIPELDDGPPFGLLLSQAASLLNGLSDESVRPLDVRARQVTFLGRIAAERPDPVATTALAQGLRIDPETLDAFVADLERKGLIESSGSHGPRAVTLTEHGQQTLVKARALLAERQAAYLAPLSEERRETLRVALAELLDHHHAEADRVLRGT